MTTLTYFLYKHLPGAHSSWTLAVLATGQADADQYVKAYNGGGKRAGKITNGAVNASCGAVTPNAAAILALENTGA